MLQLIALALAASSAAQDPEGVITVDGRTFHTWREYVESDLFRAKGLRCGAPALDGDRADVPAPDDCAYASTSPMPEYEATFTLDILVVVHVIERTSGTGHIPEAMVQSQIDVLNEDFQAIAGTLGGPGNDGMIRFHLATVDPVGDPTTGITYSVNNEWFSDSGSYWTSLAWDTHRFLNIYTNDAGGYLGYVPDIPQGGLVGESRDRVVVLWSAFGRDAPIGPPYDKGRTATHEIGHYLGLWHTFDGGCAGGDCYRTGDVICDTNSESGPEYGCPASSSSCGSPDPVHNYMNYSEELCMYEFTLEQINRMRCTLEHWRPDLATVGPDPPGTSYCRSLPNSTGAAATIWAEGSESIAANDLTLFSGPLPQDEFGIFYYGPNQIEVPFGNGFRCVGGSVQRLSVVSSGSEGRMEYALDLATAAGIGVLVTQNFQAWYRDPSASPASFNLSDGLSIEFLP